jgi:DNA-binding HxlR family transcriptional regulator
MNNDETSPTCSAISGALKIIGDKWTGLIIVNLTTGTKRFGELQQALEGISPRTLSQRLDSLEEQQVVSKKCFAEAPPRVEYSLTEKGRDILPILQSMAEWGARHDS